MAYKLNKYTSIDDTKKVEALGLRLKKLCKHKIKILVDFGRTPAYAVIGPIRNLVVFVNPILAPSVSNLARTSDFSSDPYAVTRIGHSQRQGSDFGQIFAATYQILFRTHLTSGFWILAQPRPGSHQDRTLRQTGQSVIGPSQ
jgi:hypothetical protein